MKPDILKTVLLEEAYRLTENVTPLKYDCGKLCSALCCKENITASAQSGGMQLLPGEDEIINTADGFEIKSVSDGNILVCSGKCKRNLRPFMCRIFPYYAHIKTDENKNTHISLLPDPRALRICPIVSGNGRKHRTSVYFRRNITRAIRILMRDEDIKKELIKTSSFCDGLYELYGKMFV